MYDSEYKSTREAYRCVVKAAHSSAVGNARSCWGMRGTPDCQLAWQSATPFGKTPPNSENDCLRTQAATGAVRRVGGGQWLPAKSLPFTLGLVFQPSTPFKTGEHPRPCSNQQSTAHSTTRESRTREDASHAAQREFRERGKRALGRGTEMSPLGGDYSASWTSQWRVW